MEQTEIKDPLPAKVLYFVAGYLRYRDVDRASTSASINREDGRKLWADPHVRAEVQRHFDLIDIELAKLRAESRAERQTGRGSGGSR